MKQGRPPFRMYFLAGSVVCLGGSVVVMLTLLAVLLCEWLWNSVHPAVSLAVACVLAVNAVAGALWLTDLVREKAAEHARHEED